jgi:hypothetical protein
MRCAGLTRRCATRSIPSSRRSCTCSKINYPLLATLRTLLDRAGRPVKLRLFTARSSYRDNGHLPLARDLTAHLGAKHVELCHGLSYEQYMAAMEEGHLTLDSYPFGGCNTVADSLLLRIPTVAREGSRWYNRIGPQLLRLAGLADCVASGEEEYLQTALRLIQDDSYRRQVRATLLQADLDATIFSRADAKYFVKAVDYLIAHHDQLQRSGDRRPIRIERDD